MGSCFHSATISSVNRHKITRQCLPNFSSSHCLWLLLYLSHGIKETACPIVHLESVLKQQKFPPLNAQVIQPCFSTTDIPCCVKRASLVTVLLLMLAKEILAKPMREVMNRNAKFIHLALITSFHFDNIISAKTFYKILSVAVKVSIFHV